MNAIEIIIEEKAKNEIKLKSYERILKEKDELLNYMTMNTTRLETCVSKEAMDEINELKMEILQLKEKIIKLNSQIDDYIEENKNVYIILEESKTSNKNLKIEIEAFKNKKQECEDLILLENTIEKEKLKVNLNEEQNKNKEEKKRILYLEKQLEDLQNKFESIENKNQKSNVPILDQTEFEKDQLCNKCSKNILEEPNERIAKLESLINKKESTLNKVLNNLDQNEKIISDLKKVSESKEKINKSLQKKICQIKKEHANHLSNLNQKIPNFKIEQQITELSVIKAESIVNQDELNQRISANLVDLNNYKDLVNDLTKKLQSSENERETEKNKEDDFKKILADSEDSR